MSKYYIAPNKNGRMIKIVEDVKVPISNKLKLLGRKNEDYIIRQRLVARFVNEDECKEWFTYYTAIEEWLKTFIRLKSGCYVSNTIMCENNTLTSNYNK